jgi:hypothetical protein
MRGGVRRVASARLLARDAGDERRLDGDGDRGEVEVGARGAFVAVSRAPIALLTRAGAVLGSSARAASSELGRLGAREAP